MARKSQYVIDQQDAWFTEMIHQLEMGGSVDKVLNHHGYKVEIPMFCD